MRDQKPAIRRSLCALYAGAAGCALRVCCVLIFLWLLPPSLASAQGTAAVVTGAGRLLVRRGPSKGFAPFAALGKGTKVEVQEMHGEWARIVTPGGQVGYVKSNFLAFPGEQRPATATPGEPASAAAESGEAALRSLTDRNQSLESEVQSLHEELAALKARAETPAPVPAGPVAADAEQLSVDLKRLTAAVEGLQHRIDSWPMPEGTLPMVSTKAAGTPAGVSPMAILLGGVGLSVGWLVGTAYSRRQDRGRRSRIRF
jgi:hypothetical protein